MPEPMAPKKSANTDRAPMHNPPNAAAVGIYLEDKSQDEKATSNMLKCN